MPRDLQTLTHRTTLYQPLLVASSFVDLLCLNVCPSPSPHRAKATKQQLCTNQHARKNVHPVLLQLRNRRNELIHFSRIALIYLIVSIIFSIFEFPPHKHLPDDTTPTDYKLCTSQPFRIFQLK